MGAVEGVLKRKKREEHAFFYSFLFKQRKFSASQIAERAACTAIQMADMLTHKSLHFCTVTPPLLLLVYS